MSVNPTKTTKDLLTGELQDLREEIALVSPKDTPLVSMIYSMGKVVPATDITVSWREKELNGTRATALMEGAEAGTPLKSTRKMFNNYCQIFEKVVSVSGTMGALKPHGVGNEYAQELTDRLIELKRDMEYYFFNGTKQAEAVGTGRQMNGLYNLVSASNVIDKSSSALTLADIEDGMQKMWEHGANGDVYLFVNAQEKRAINKFCQANDITVTTEMLDGVVGVKVDTIETDFGTVHVVLDRHITSGTVIGVDMNYVEVGELRSVFHETLAKTGDYEKGHVLAELTIKLTNQYAGFKIVNITAE